MAKVWIVLLSIFATGCQVLHAIDKYGEPLVDRPFEVRECDEGGQNCALFPSSKYQEGFGYLFGKDIGVRVSFMANTHRDTYGPGAYGTLRITFYNLTNQEQILESGKYEPTPSRYTPSFKTPLTIAPNHFVVAGDLGLGKPYNVKITASRQGLQDSKLIDLPGRYITYAEYERRYGKSGIPIFPWLDRSAANSGMGSVFRPYPMNSLYKPSN